MSSAHRKPRSVVACSLLLLCVVAPASGFAAVRGPQQPSGRSVPKDTRSYVRAALPEDFAPGGRIALLGTPQVFMVDVVVNNTDPTLIGTDNFNDGETSIAINPANSNEIVGSTFSGGWGANAPVWHSLDGGVTWTKRFTVPAPPGVPLTGPNDQAFDFGRSNLLSGVFLNNNDLFSGISTGITSSANWNWLISGGVAQRANAPVTFGNADQPWLLVNRDPTTAGQDNVYVAYDDFGPGSNARVAVSYGANPPSFTTDNATGPLVYGGGLTVGVNPGHRMAKDPTTGFMYSLWQSNINNGPGGSVNVDYRLNRSTDGGATWTLNGSATGIVVANADSTQGRTGCPPGCPCPIKFGGVNGLLGGVDHAAVDPGTGDLYYVYGNRDAGTGNNRLAIRRITNNGSGGVTVGAQHFVTGQVQAAIPSVAILADGTIGVFYYTFDGVSSTNFPIFTTHLAISQDHGVTFPTDIPLLTFLSSAMDCCLTGTCATCPTDPCGQRVFGDYMQMKAMGQTFYGLFTGNGVPFGRPFADHDPIFFKTTIAPVIQVPSSVDFAQTTCLGSTDTQTMQVCNTGVEDLQVSSIASSNPLFTPVTPSGGFPVIIAPGACFPFQVTFAPTAAGPQSSTLTIDSNDPATPAATVSATATGGSGTIATVVANTGNFGDICRNSFTDLNITVNNNGACDLSLTGITSSSTVYTAPTVASFPLIVAHGTSIKIPIRFTPTGLGTVNATITIASNDPLNPMVMVAVTGAGHQCGGGCGAVGWLELGAMWGLVGAAVLVFHGRRKTARRPASAG